MSISGQMQLKLLLADDHNLFRDALVQYIKRANPEAEVLLARDIHGVMEIMEHHSDIHLVLLDLRMPGMNGLQGLEKLREIYPHVPVALLSGIAEKEDVEQAVALGAAGYFPKTMSGQALLKGIMQIVEGRPFVAKDHNTDEPLPSYHDGGYGTDRSGVRHPLEGFEAPKPEALQKLTPREKEVLEFLRRGESNKEIARALDLQVVTVKLHVRGICRKLGARNRTQAALFAQGQSG